MSIIDLILNKFANNNNLEAVEIIERLAVDNFFIQASSFQDYVSGEKPTLRRRIIINLTLSELLFGRQHYYSVSASS